MRPEELAGLDLLVAARAAAAAPGAELLASVLRCLAAVPMEALRAHSTSAAEQPQRPAARARAMQAVTAQAVQKQGARELVVREFANWHRSSASYASAAQLWGSVARGARQESWPVGAGVGRGRPRVSEEGEKHSGILR